MAVPVTLRRDAWIRMELETQLRHRLERAIPSTDGRARLPHGHPEPAGLFRRITASSNPGQ